MNSRALSLLLAVALGLVALGGCSTDNNERQRLVAEADLLNGGSPLIIAAVNAGSPSDLDDDFVPIEFVSVVFSARALNNTMVIPDGSPYSTFNVTGYDLVWRPNTGAPAELTAYNVSRGNLTVTVPVDDIAAASILVGNLAMKAEPWFVDMFNGARAPFTAELDLTFYGHESSSEHEVAIHAGTSVLFVPSISEN